MSKLPENCQCTTYDAQGPSNKARNKVSHEIYEIDWSRVRGHEIGCTRWVESEVNTEIAAVSVKQQRLVMIITMYR